MSYASRRDIAVANEYLANHATCRKCRQQVTTEMLSNFGGQCGACFAAYTREIQPKHIPRTIAERRAVLERLGNTTGVGQGDARMVVRRLRELRESGMRLTPNQEWVLKCCEQRTGVRREETV